MTTATRNRARDRWPNEPAETYEPGDRDHAGLFDDQDFALVLAVLQRRGIPDSAGVARLVLAALERR